MDTVNISGQQYPYRKMPDGRNWTTLNLEWEGGGHVRDWGDLNFPTGRYYAWQEYPNIQSVLPPGWRVPNRADWAELIEKCGGVEQANNLKASGNAYGDGDNTSDDRWGFGLRACGMLRLLGDPPGTVYDGGGFRRTYCLLEGEGGYLPPSPPLGEVYTYTVGNFVIPGIRVGEYAAGWYAASVRLVQDPQSSPVDPLPAEYTQQLVNLLPKGPAWTRRPGTNMRKLLSACGEELARVHTLALHILDEWTPSKTVDSLPEWEMELGLPEAGTPLGATAEARRREIVRKFRTLGGCSAGYFEELAAILGYTVTVSELYEGAHPFKAGSSAAGDALTQGRYLFTWKMTVAGVEGPDTYLETIMRSMAPRHTLIYFEYTA